MDNKEKDIRELDVNETEQANGGFTGTVLGDQLVQTLYDEYKKVEKAFKEINVIPSPIDKD